MAARRLTNPLEAHSPVSERLENLSVLRDGEAGGILQWNRGGPPSDMDAVCCLELGVVRPFHLGIADA